MLTKYNTFKNNSTTSADSISHKTQATANNIHRKNNPNQSDSAVFGLPDIMVELLGSVIEKQLVFYKKHI